MEPMEQMEQYMMCIHLLDLVRLPWLPLDLWICWFLVEAVLEDTTLMQDKAVAVVEEVLI
jgi:hypothetical protein